MARPRSVTLEPEGMIALGKEMVDWVNDNPDTIHLCEWYSLQKHITYNEWKTIIQKKEFIPYYEEAISIIGLKYLKKDSIIRDNIAPRWVRIYFKDLRDSEDNDLDAASARAKNVNDNSALNFTDLCDKIKDGFGLQHKEKDDK